MRPLSTATLVRRVAAIAATIAFSFLGAATAQAQGGGAEREPAGEGLRLSWSAFGTLGYAQSNRPYNYFGSIDNDGTLRRDTVFGAQLDAQLSSQWSATVQTKLAASAKSETGWDVTASWAFAAWRPNNDWLVRLGKLRVPFVLRSEQLDVGATYDEARLPAEIYSLAPTNDFTGAAVARSWNLSAGEVSLELYRGSAALAKRFYLREGIPPFQAAGPLYREVNTTVEGVSATWRAPDLMARVGLHHATTRLLNGQMLTVRPTLVVLGPGITYWQTETALPGPGVAKVDRINNLLLTAGFDAHLSNGWRVAAEGAKVWQRDIEFGVHASGGYFTVYRLMGAFTPYATVAGMNSTNPSTSWSRTLDSTTVPGFVPGAAVLNAAMRTAADTLPIYRQSSFTLGTSFTWSPQLKLKAEWMQTRARQSQLIDVPAGEPLEARRRIDVLSTSLSFVF